MGTPPPAAADPTVGADAEPLGRRFSILLAFSGLSNLADGILLVAVPLLALTLTQSPAEISLVAVAAQLPWLLFALHVGVLVDRFDRRRMLVWATAVRVLALAAGTAAALTGALTLPLLLALLLLFGTAEVVADSSATVLVPSVVPRTRLGAANSRLLGVQQAANAFVGGPLGGLLVTAGAGWIFGVPAALCVAGLLLVLGGLRGPYRAAGHVRAPVRTELGEGVRFLRGHRVVRPLLVSGTVLNFASAAYMAVFVLWVVGPGSAVGLDAAMYGLLLMAFAAGAITGAVLAERLLVRLSEARLITGSWLVSSLLLAVPVLVPEVWAVAGSLALIGVTNMVGNVVNASMRQRLVPNRLLGRVGGVSRMVSYGSMPLGAALGGVVGELFGLRAVFLGAVALSVAFVVKAMVAVPQWRIDAADADLDGAAPAAGVPAH
ncbi:MFS transporter [Georgenia sp. MJ206]|uniref:MFS transporter n=1 Tax=Georgenia wangjunii TaxID=3117730 RepID=UPI002F263597